MSARVPLAMRVARVRTGKPIERQGLSTAWERRVGRTATVLAVVTLMVSVGFAVGSRGWESPRGCRYRSRY